MDKFLLTNENIEKQVEKTEEFFLSYGIDKKEVLRRRLLVEEILIKYQQRFGAESEISIIRKKVFNQVRCIIKVENDAYNPIESEDDFASHMFRTLTDYEGGTPNWTYRDGCNIIFIAAIRKHKTSLFGFIVLALAIGLIGGLLCKKIVNEAILLAAVENYLQPLANMYSGLLCVMAVLLAFFALPIGINAVGNADQAGKFAKKVILEFYKIMGITTIAFALILGLIYQATLGGNVAVATKSLFDILIGFFPAGLIAPFIEFNSVQIMIISLMFGLSLLAMGEKGAKVFDLFDSYNLAAVLTNTYLNNFVPIYVGICAFNIIATTDVSALRYAPKIIYISLIGFVLLVVGYTIEICMKYKVNPQKFAHKLLPTFLIALSTGSVGATFTTAISTCFELTEDENSVNFTFNLGTVIFKPAHSITFIVSSIILANAYGVQISVPWLIFAILLAVILPVAVPGVPGASASVYALLFTQLGLPNAALAVMISINAFFEFVIVAVNHYCIQCENFLLGGLKVDKIK